MEANKKYPAFMKPFLSGCSQKMQIHPSFTSFMQGLVPNKSFLKNCHGKLLPVGVSKVGDDFYFHEGWRKFVQENEIEFGTLLVFQYNGDSIFDVKILGKTASEDEILQAFEFDTKERNVAEEEAKNEVEVEVEVEMKVEEGEEEEGENIEMLKKRRWKRKNETFGASSNDDMQDDDDNTNNSPPKTGYMNGNPYFVSKVTQKRKNSLNVPCEIVSDNEIKLGEVINVRDPHGYTWCANVAPWNDGRVWLKGWSQLYRRNHMYVGDEFICEVVQGKGSTETYIQVHLCN